MAHPRPAKPRAADGADVGRGRVPAEVATGVVTDLANFQLANNSVAKDP
jgi:hypothetical protein